MPNFLARLLITTVAVLISAYFLNGVHVYDVTTALVVALVLALMNTFIKPVLVLLTIPITILTLGLFVLVINVLIIKWTAGIVSGFTVDNWWWALLFSLLLSLVTSILEKFLKTKDQS